MTTVLFIIGYFVVGVLVFRIIKTQDNYYYRKLYETFGNETLKVSMDYGIPMKSTEAQDEFHRRTTLSIETTKNTFIVGCLLSSAIMILWPVATIVSLIRNWIVFKQIMKKAETPD